jgi:spermidine/putrescine transport system ATP-binding protein
VRIDGADMRGVAPEQRPVNTVFQSYALFPHKSVADNVAFGLRFQKCTKDETRRRVGEALELVRLTGYEQRRPHQLSGGQQQRVALARSLVLRPKVLLLDEPLGALDAKLRRTLQVELRQLHRDVGITFVYVTHDQEEALTMSDRLAVMNHGILEQVGTPREVYDRPANTYVADFLGVANLLPAVAGPAGVEVLGRTVAAATDGVTGNCYVVVRPERVGLVDPVGSSLRGTVVTVVFAGALTHVHVRVGDHELQAMVPNGADGPALVEGAEVGVDIAPDAVRVLPN